MTDTWREYRSWDELSFGIMGKGIKYMFDFMNQEVHPGR